MGKVFAREIVPVVWDQLVTVGFQVQRWNLLRYLVELYAVSNIDKCKQTVLALNLELFQIESIRLFHHVEKKILVKFLNAFEWICVNPFYEPVSDFIWNIFSKQIK